MARLSSPLLDSRYRILDTSAFTLIDPGHGFWDDAEVHRSAGKSGFTLIELLVVIAIVAVLAVVVVVVLNPAQLIQQARDSNRLSDLATINSGIAYYLEDQAPGYLGIASTSYISVADPTATSTAGDQCQGLGMPSLGSSSWQCAESSTTRSANGTGWIPVNFSALSVGSPLGQLPADPANQTSTGLFYSYSTNGSQYLVSAILESSKYKSQFATNPSIPYFPEVVAVGSNFSISPLYNSAGLVAYWPMDEGSGSSTLDASGNSNAGTWAGTPSGSNGTYYAAGKVGSSAGYFNGTSNAVSVISISTSSQFLNGHTVTAWINATVLNAGHNIFFSFTRPYFSVETNQIFQDLSVGGVDKSVNGHVVLALGTWYFVAGTYNDAQQAVYVNGTINATSSASGSETFSASLCIGTHNSSGCSGFPFKGSIDDVRLYNRALSAGEIQALYNAEK